MAMKAAEELKSAGIMATVVSMPSFKIFEEQDENYKMSIFPHGVPKICDRGRRDDGLVQVHRARRHCDRAGPVWSFGSGAAGAGEAGHLRRRLWLRRQRSW